MIIETILNLLFPPKCPFCRKVQDAAGICAACEKTLPRTGEKSLLEEKKSTRCCAPLWYEDTVRETLLRLKFGGASALAEPLGEEIARCAAEHFGGEFDIVTWVPVSRKRLRKRGYDQARLLAEAACRCWETKPEQLLKKTVDNPAQSGIRDMAARRANVLGVYETVNRDLFAGKRVLLVDDIRTTGATLEECVRVLRDAGAEAVVCTAAAFSRRK